MKTRAMALVSLVFFSSLLFPEKDPLLQDTIDFHVHADPDNVARSADIIEVAQKAKEAGMRALVFKSHSIPTAGYAYLARKLVPDVAIFGGIALNLSTGGINPSAIETMLAVRGSFGRVVWMPTFDAENHIRFFSEERRSVRISQNGRLLPEVEEILKLIAKHDLILATGHSSPEEIVLLIEAARAAGVTRILVTHPMMNPINLTIEQQKRAARRGAFLEHAAVGTLQGPSAPVAALRHWRGVSAAEFAAAIKAVGAGHCILSSDLGQAGNPLHTDGLRHFILALKAEGINDQEIHLMTRVNPARLLGL